MTYEEYIDGIEKLKSANEQRIISIIPDVQDEVLRSLMKWIDYNLDIQRGNLFVTEETKNILNTFDQDLLDLFKKMKGYNRAIDEFIKELKPISGIIKTYQQKANGIDWSALNLKPTEKLVIDEIINSYKDAGINAEFIQPLRDLLYQNVIAGSSLGDAKQGIKEYVKGGKDKSGKLKSYLTSTTQQAVDSYTGAINKKLMDTFDYPVLIMSGSLISTSSPQCRKAVEEKRALITEKIFEEELRPIAEKNGLIKGTTFMNLPFNRLHWGCRHEFTPSMIKPGDKIGTNEIF